MGRTWPSANTHVKKVKSAVEGDPKKSRSWVETEAGARVGGGGDPLKRRPHILPD